MAQDAKSAERDRLAAALRANLRRRKATPRPAKIDPKRREQAAETSPPDAAADGESKG